VISGFFFLLIVYYLDLRGSREESSSLVARVANVEAGPVALEAVEEEIEADFAWPLEADLLGGKGGADSATALAQNNRHHQPKSHLRRLCLFLYYFSFFYIINQRKAARDYLIVAPDAFD
jgi:hypothetical protein